MCEDLSHRMMHGDDDDDAQHLPTYILGRYVRKELSIHRMMHGDDDDDAQHLPTYLPTYLPTESRKMGNSCGG